MLDLIADILCCILDLFLSAPRNKSNDRSIVGESPIEVRMQRVWRVLAIIVTAALIVVFYHRAH